MQECMTFFDNGLHWKNEPDCMPLIHYFVIALYKKRST